MDFFQYYAWKTTSFCWKEQFLSNPSVFLVATLYIAGNYKKTYAVIWLYNNIVD